MTDRATSNEQVAAGSKVRGRDPAQVSYVPKERVSAIYDGIVAIAATLLVLEVGGQITGEVMNLADVQHAFRRILHWIISFMMIAVLWTEFHFVFAHSRRWDVGLLALTFGQLAALSLVPFASGLVGDYPDSVIAALIFAGVMTLNGLLMTLIALTLRRKAHLHHDDNSHMHLSTRIRAQMAVYSGVAAVSVLGAYLHHPVWGIIGWLICPVALILILGPAARRMDREDGT